MDEKGEKSLQWFRGAGADIKTELNQIRNAHIMSKKYQIKLKDLLGKAYVKPLLVSIGLMFFQQFSGVRNINITD
jgi:facilitated trehalose transporter